MEKTMHRDDFFWGVCGHPRRWRAYPESQLDNQMRAAADLGVTHYRMDLPYPSEDDLLYCDKVLATAKKYGLTILGILYGSGKTPAEIEENARQFALRYKDDITLYQIENEIDCPTLIPGRNPLGLKISDYSTEKLDVFAEKLRAMIAGIRAGNPEARISINGTWWHTGFMDYFIYEKGLEFDIIGWDWYSNMCDKSSINEILDKLCSYGHDIILSEANFWPTVQTEAGQGAYIAGLMRKVYEYPSDKIKGLFIYELLDEVQPANQSNSVECHFGIYRCDEHGNIGEPKPAYHDIKKRIQDVHKMDLTSCD